LADIGKDDSSSLRRLYHGDAPTPSMRRPVIVKNFLFFFYSSLLWEPVPVSQAASVAFLPSALFVERFFARCQLGVLDSAGAAT
jgi:hypothetical protein